jgi:cellulose biosynthesis protein BcsQ
MPTWVDQLGTHAAELWETIQWLSARLKPVTDVLKPIIDLGGVTIAVMIAVYQFLGKRKLRLKLERVERAISNGEDEPWLLYNPQPFKERRGLFQRSSPEERDTRYICFYNQKGGVGKTTLAMTFAAYLDQKGLNTLLIDLDYQGSLSSGMLAACGVLTVDSKVNEIFEKNLIGDDVVNLAISLAKTRSVLAPKAKLPNTEIITSYYPFGKLENKLQLKWLVDDDFKTDLRHVVAKAVRSPSVRKKFDVVIFDCPPRLTTGTVNAICASTHLLIPTVLDKLSGEAVGPTLQTAKKLANKLNPDLELLGVVGNLTRQDELGPTEREALQMVRLALEIDGWGQRRMFRRTIPRRVAVTNAAGEDVAYLNKKEDFSKIFDDLGDELLEALDLMEKASSKTGSAAFDQSIQYAADFAREDVAGVAAE